MINLLLVLSSLQLMSVEYFDNQTSQLLRTDIWIYHESTFYFPSFADANINVKQEDKTIHVFYGSKLEGQIIIEKEWIKEAKLIKIFIDNRVKKDTCVEFISYNHDISQFLGSREFYKCKFITKVEIHFS